MIKLDDQPLSNRGLIPLTGHSHPFPETRDYTAQMVGDDGSYDFGSDYGNRNFEFPIGYINYDRYQIQRTLREFMSVLLDRRGKPKKVKLTFDHEPDKQYWVRYSGSVPLNRLLQTAEFTLPLTAFKPMAEFVQETKNFTLADDYPMQSDLRADRDYEFTVTSDTTLIVDNFGTVACEPIIEIDGSADSLTLSTNGESFSFGQFSGVIEVDCNRWIVKKDGVNYLNSMSGDFIELLTGDNNVDVSGTNMNVDIHFKFKPKYL